MHTARLRGLLATMLSLPLMAAEPLQFFVATNGNDGWSGSRPTISPERKDGPKATLTAALSAARAARRTPAGAEAAIEIQLRGGTYELAEPLRLTVEDSGLDAERPLRIMAYKRERPVLSGGRRLQGWKELTDTPGTWEVSVPPAADGQPAFRSLFLNDERMPRSRTPNLGYYRIQGNSPQDRPIRIPFREGDIRKSWAEVGDVEVVAYLAWADLRMPIRSVDEANRVATLAGNPRESNRENHAQYFIENAPDTLDFPGEWYLDRRDGKARYLARPKENPNRARVVVPRLQELLVVQGDLAARQAVRHLVLSGLTFAHTDWTLAPEGYADVQAAFEVAGDVRFEAAQDCAVLDCRFVQLAGYGLELGRGCQRLRIVGNELTDLGAGGIRVGEPAARSEAFEQTHSITITDNHLYHLGRVFTSGIGVMVFQSGQNRIAHNHIHDLFYTAISLGWNWGYQETPCRENVVEFNHLHDIGQNLLSDMGAIYTLGIQKGTRIANNLIHDVQAFTYGGWGLYTDEGSSDIVLESNVVYHCKSAGFHQHYGRDNRVRNNVFAFNQEHQLMRSREEAHASFVFEHNIIYFNTGDLLGSQWSNDHFRMDSNLYFDTRLAGAPENLRFKDASWTQWRERGHDRNSRIADPLFAAPEKFNFQLQKQSPALALGFHPIDLTTVGVRKR